MRRTGRKRYDAFVSRLCGRPLTGITLARRSPVASDRPAIEVIEKLVAQWRANAAVEAVLLFGSHAHGTTTDQSDIDLYVLASNAAQVTGDGLHWMSGHLVEVFVNTRSFFEGHFERFHADHS